MTGAFYIDAKHAYDHYGVVMAEGSFGDIASPASLKKVDFNDWPEEDGIEPDLSAPVLSSRQFDIEFLCVDASKLGAFFTQLSGVGYHEFDIPELGIIRNYRLVQEGKNESISDLEFFTLKFADDKPLDGYTYLAPANGVASEQGYKLDLLSFTNYGITVLEGAKDAIRKTPAAKQNLIVDSQYASGADYDTGSLYFKEKDVTLSLLIQAPTVAVFWQNYNAFIYDFVRPELRSLTTPYGVYPCFYNSAKVQSFMTNSWVWCVLELKLTFSNFRL